MLLLDPLARPIIAHRGDRAHAPENTLRAFSLGIDAGADALELDVHLSSDGHVVVCHDATVDRTTNGSGAIEEMPYAALRELDAGDGQHLPLLSEVLEMFARSPLIIDFKVAAVAEPALELLTRTASRNRVIVGSFGDAPTLLARRVGFATTATEAELKRMLPAAVVGRAMKHRGFNAVAMPPTHYRLPLPVSGYVRSSGVPVHVWTVNDPGRAVKLWRAGVRGIITDDPAIMVAARRTLAPSHSPV
ncbi:MAG TPA: glycerophosphodiester phosphodiesterase family protein [Gemmatimonadaceae bacterium]|nr:glycerophosphodiester phosphodiesterase family protein [Gemmatimonadaceae bacterium]